MDDAGTPVPAAAQAVPADADTGIESRFRDLVRRSPLPLNLTRLSDGQTVEVSDAFAVLGLRLLLGDLRRDARLQR